MGARVVPLVRINCSPSLIYPVPDLPSASDVKEVVDVSLNGDGSLYGEVPDAVKGMGKGKR